MHREDESGIVRSGLDVVAKPEDVVVHRARHRQLRVAPHIAEQLLAADDLAAVGDEIAQQLEFMRLQLEVAVPSRNG